MLPVLSETNTTVITQDLTTLGIAGELIVLY